MMPIVARMLTGVVLSLSFLVVAGLHPAIADVAANVVEGQTTKVNNCSLVTNEEATKLAGRNLTHGEDGPLGCPYMRDNSKMGYFIVRAFNGKGPAKDNMGRHSSNTVVREIQGVGDSAAVLVDGKHVNFLIVQKGGRYVQFVTTFLSQVNLDSPKLKEAESLALVALDRLK